MESFGADEITCKKCVKIDPVYQEALDGLAKEWDNIGYPRDEIKCPSCGKRVIVNTYDAEEFEAETCPMCENENPIIGGEVCAECTQYLEDEQDRFSQRNGAESFDATSDELDCSSCKATPKDRMGEPLCSTCNSCFECCETLCEDESFDAEEYLDGEKCVDCKTETIYIVKNTPKDLSYLLCYTCGSEHFSDELYFAESFDAQTKITGYTRGKDWEGKPYTGQIFPDHSDLDHELADRNQDGKMASWERAIGNQVARGKSRFKAPRKMLNPRLPQKNSSTTHSSILPYALAVGALATIMGLRNMGGSNE